MKRIRIQLIFAAMAAVLSTKTVLVGIQLKRDDHNKAGSADELSRELS